jgi:uncharacterized protein
MRDQIAKALTAAQKAQDRLRVSTLRLVSAAIKDRDIANRGTGKEPASADEIRMLLAKMIKQREESAAVYDQGKRPELAAQERGEIAIISEFLPKQLSEAETEAICKAVIAETGAQGIRDMGKCMAILRERYPGQMDFAKASGVLKTLLG